MCPTSACVFWVCVAADPDYLGPKLIPELSSFATQAKVRFQPGFEPAPERDVPGGPRPDIEDHRFKPNSSFARSN